MHTLACYCSRVVPLVTLLLALPSFGAGRVVITEIMYNPNSKEDKGQTEWVEIANVGDETVEINNWRLDDEDRWDWGKFSCTLEPGGVAVLFNADYVTEADFRAAWDSNQDGNADGQGDDAVTAYRAIAVKWGGIANTPGVDNEILQLLDDKGEVICEVHQTGQWPDCSRPDGSSIYLVDLSASNLSDPSLWKKSDRNVAGARENANTQIFNGSDIGSPGYVPGLENGLIAAATPTAAPTAAPANDKPAVKQKKPAKNPPASAPATAPATQPDNTIDY